MAVHKKGAVTINFLHLLMLLLVVLVDMIKYDFQYVWGEIILTRCIEGERRALVSFKQGLVDEYGLLSSWQSEDQDCCKWKGVHCSNTTNHVIALKLGGSSTTYFYNFRGKISSTLLELRYLNEFDLTYNDFGGIRIPEFFGSMKSLQHLDLRYSNFSGIIPPQLGNLTNLCTLYLGHNKLDGPIPDALGGLVSLQSLDLSVNKLKGGIPKSLGNLSHLHELSLSGNDLGVPFEALLGNLSSTQMTFLELSHAHLTGSVSATSLAQLSKLESLDLSYNSLQGTISEAHFIKLINLRKLGLSSNLFTFNLSPDWVPPFDLEEIYLANCKLGPSFPRWLQTLRNLTQLDLSNNGISAQVPKWFWNLSTQVAYLNISHNMMSGTIPDLSSIVTDMIDVSSNKFSGPLPLLYPKTLSVLLSQNKFSGSNVSSFVCTFTKGRLMLLDLSNNQLEGQIPNCWENMTLLSILNLNNNNLSGEIPQALGSLAYLKSLHLRDNNLSGELPLTLKNCQWLWLIDVGGNKLTGNIPPWLGGENNKFLTYLSLRQNRFYGGIPPQLCKLTRLQMLDVSENNISGKIPQCFNNFTSLVGRNSTTSPISLSYGDYDYYYEYASVQWKHGESEYRKNLGLLKLIDLSSNKLVGNIPKAFSTLRGLLSLNLSRNSLTGNMDPNIGEMEMLESLDLSMNQLSGEIPIGLTKLHYLAVLDLANNNLSGKIPTGTQLQSFDASVYAENSDLCGLPLMSCLNTSITDEGENIEEKDSGFTSLSFMQEVGISMVFGFIVGFWGVVGSLILKKSWRSAYFKLLGIAGDWFYVNLAIFLNKFKRS